MFDDGYWMNLAFKEALKAYDKKEVPVGAIIVLDNTLIGKGYNQVEILHDATAHAEILAITSAENYLNNWRLSKTTIYVTKEPCIMCAGAIINSRISKVVFSAYDKEEGAAGSKYDFMRESKNRFIEIIPGVLNEKGENLLKQFFNEIRNKKNINN